MDTWKAILIGFGGSAILLMLALGWLARSLGSRAPARELEKFKADLAAAFSAELEIFKAELAAASSAATKNLKDELQCAALENEVRFTKLHERHAEVVTQLYGLLVEAHRASQRFVSSAECSGGPSKREMYDAAVNGAAELYGFFDKNRIYLPEALSRQLEQFFQNIRSEAIEFGTYVTQDTGHDPAHFTREQMDVWLRAHEYLEKEMPGLRAALEAALRGILGSMPGVGVNARVPGEFPGPTGNGTAG